MGAALDACLRQAASADITMMMAPAGDNQNGAQSLAEFLTGSIATAGSE
jgi:hypothetical protein